MLNPGWQRTNAGPLLAFRSGDKRPVAFLPIRDGEYRIFDPSEDTLSTVREVLPNQFQPHAYMFYRSFPSDPRSPLAPYLFGIQGKAVKSAPFLPRLSS